MAGGIARKRLCLIDGHGQLYRSFYAIQGLTRSDGHPTHGTFGFFRVLFKTLKILQPTHLAIAFDPSGPTFREDLFKDYKADRPVMPDSLRIQLSDTIGILSRFRVPILQLERFEADDCLATAARWAQEKDWDAVVVTSDKDMLQLVNDHIMVYNPIKGIPLRTQDVVNYMGVEPSKIADLLALCGDTTDGIPGVPGIGPKTAVKLLDKYGTVEDIFHVIQRGCQLDSALKKAASIGERLLQWKELTLLKDDVDIDLDENRMMLGRSSPSEISSIFREFEMNSLIEESICLFCHSDLHKEEASLSYREKWDG